MPATRADLPLPPQCKRGVTGAAGDRGRGGAGRAVSTDLPAPTHHLQQKLSRGQEPRELVESQESS